MTRHFFMLIIVFAALLALSSCSGDPASELATDVYSKTELRNGMTLHALPTGNEHGDLITLTIRLESAAINEGPEETGYSSLATRYFATAFADDQASVVKYYVENTPEALYVSAQCLPEDIENIVGRIVDTLTTEIAEETFTAIQPALISQLQNQAAQQLNEVQDQFNANLFANTPFAAGYEQRLNSVASATTDSINQFLKRTVSPERASAAISGRLTRQDLSMAAGALVRWTGKGVDDGEAGMPSVDEQQGSFNLVDVERENAAIYVLKNVPTLQPGDFYALEAVNFILNGAVEATRLGEINRLLAGAGAVSSNLDTRKSAPNMVIAANCRAGNALEVVSAIRAELEVLLRGALNDQRFSGQEILDARNHLFNRLVRQTHPPRNRNRFVLWAANYGFSNPLPEAHLQMIKNINRKDIERVVETYINRDPLVNSLLVAGPAEVLREQFEGWEQGSSE